MRFRNKFEMMYFRLQSNKIFMRHKCKNTGILGNFHGLLKNNLSPALNSILIFNDLKKMHTCTFVRDNTSSATPFYFGP